jgi:hypothetical protein
MIAEVCSGGPLFDCQSADGWFPFILSKTKIGIVALARKLLVALWRYLEDGEMPAGAQLKA